MSTGSVIWITGLSGAGKTSVARIVFETLKFSGVNTYWMDGDEIRKILGNKWGYSIEERVELAHVYGRIAASMAENGITVVCSVVALFDEVRIRNRQNIENYTEVFLRVPLDVLAERDSKGHYQKFLGADDPESVVSSDYQMPDSPDLIIGNFGVVDAHESAKRILATVFSQMVGGPKILSQPVSSSSAMLGIKDYWESYYSKRIAPSQPSTFAIFCKENYLEDGRSVFEIGCGNGRDSFFFARTNPVFGIDTSENVVQANREFAAENGFNNTDFVSGFFGETEGFSNRKFGAIYSRFVLHAMDETFEDRAITLSQTMLSPGGLFLAEFRTLDDPMAQEGVIVGVNERVTDHYRRFIDAASVVAKLEAANFEILYSIESDGLAVYKDDNPVVARIVARLAK